MEGKPEALGDLARLRQAIENGPFDAVVALSPENVRYAGNVNIATQRSIRERLALIVWAKGQEPSILVCNIEEGYVRKVSWIEDVRTYVEFKTSPIHLLAEVLEELELEKGRIGIELEYLVAHHYRQLMERLPGLRLEPCEELFARVRMIKTPREINLMTRAYRSTEKALMATFATVQVGETEKSLSNRLANNIMHAGADSVAFHFINAGPNTGYPHAEAGDYQVRSGDIVRTDCGGFYKEYFSNVGRTAKVGKPSEEDISIWNRLRAIHHELIGMLRPGRTGREVYEAAARLHKKADLAFPYPHNGHSIGLNVHERPVVNPFEDILYAPNMVSTVETRARWPGKVGYHMEDLMLITEGAPVVLSDFFDNEELFVI